MNRVGPAVVASILVAGCVGEPELGHVDQADGSGSAADAGVDGAVDYSAYFTPGAETPWVFDSSGESLQAAGYIGPVPTQCLASTPALKGTVQSCTEFASAPDGLPTVIATCDANANIDCNWGALCVYVYQDIAGCDGNCFSQSTAKLARKTTFLTNSATGAFWRATVCAGAVSTGVAKARCWTGSPLVCRDYWPVPTPNTTCT